MRLVLFGPPASGKGTQGRRLASSLSLGYLSTGALLREHVENATPLGLSAKPILASGEYLPDELMFPILADWLDHQTGQTGWVLDGFPRSLPQAAFLDGWLEAHALKLDAAISLEVPYDELLQRMRNRVECPACRWTGQRGQLAHGTDCPKCGATASRRADDDEQNFNNRFTEFSEITLPLVKYYEDRKSLISVQATAPQDEVAALILAEVMEKASVSLPSNR
ncbi:MAG: nucleoside monophosphate kinase [Armatimonadetes bacterium]|nr:nucleoside monophosphate kinase [Akkermansiaceae bacterium]